MAADSRTEALRSALEDTRTTLRAVRAKPHPDAATLAALERLADSIEGAGFMIAAAVANQAGDEAGTYAAGFLAGRSSRRQMPRPGRAGRDGQTSLRLVAGGGR
jgi:hypothetical protein